MGRYRRTMFEATLNGQAELKALAEHDAPTLFAVVDQNRAYLRRWLPWVDRTDSAEASRHFIRYANRAAAARQSVTAGIWVDGRLCGTIGAHEINWENRATSIGYWIAESCQGRGLVTAASRALVTYLFRDLSLHRIEIRCATSNHKSCAIPERLGFIYEGVAHEAQWLNDRFVDLGIWAMLRHQWTNPTL